MGTKFTYDFVKISIESEGYVLHSSEYINAHQRLDIECDKGHRYKPLYLNWRRGHRCTECGYKSTASKSKLTYDHVKTYIESYGYTLHSDEYINDSSLLVVGCDKGHIYKVKYGNFRTGKRCPVCANNITLSLDYVKGEIESDQYKLLSNEYVNNTTHLNVRCPKGHEYPVMWLNWKKGHRCPVCDREKSSSKAEQEIREYVSQFVGVIGNDRTTVTNPLTGNMLELDVWIPSQSKAIEYNGDYWHSFDSVKKHDKIKQQYCSENGILLLTIKESDYKSDKNKCLDTIREFVN